MRKLFAEQNAWLDRRFAASTAPTPTPTATTSVTTAPAPSAAASVAPATALAPARSAIDAVDGADPSFGQKLVQCGPVDIEKGGDAMAHLAPSAAIVTNQIHYNADAEPDPEHEVEASVGQSTQMLLAMGQILSVSSNPIVSNSVSSSEPTRHAPHPARAAPYPPAALKAPAAANSPYGVYSKHIAISHTLGMRAHADPAPRQQQLRREGRGMFPSLIDCATVGMNIIFVGAKMAPWSTTGGLDDVLGGLPPAMAMNGSHGMAWSTHAAEATPTSSPTSTLPGGSTPSLAMLSSISLEHASLGARQVFEELSLHADIFCNICIGFELPSRMSLGVDQHQPWPPPDDLRLMSCDAELRPIPWPSFNRAERLSVRSSCGRLWKPPWPIQICQQIRFVLSDLAVSWKYMMIPVLGAMEMCASVDLRSIPWPSFSVFHEFIVQWCCVFDCGKCHLLGGILVRKFSGAHKPIASVCRGQLILAAARVIENRIYTTYPFVTPVWVAAGAKWEEHDTMAKCTVDDPLITPATYDSHPEFISLIVNAFGDSVAGSDKKMLFLCGEHTWVSPDEHELEVLIFQLQQPWPPPAVLPPRPLPWPPFSSYAASVQLHTSLSVVLCYHPPLSVSVGGNDCSDGAHLAAVVVLLVTTMIVRGYFLYLSGFAQFDLHVLRSISLGRTYGLVPLVRLFHLLFQGPLNFLLLWQLRSVEDAPLLSVGNMLNAEFGDIWLKLPWPPPLSKWVWFQLSANCVLSCSVSKLRLTIFRCVSCWECWKHWLKLLESAVQVAELNGREAVQWFQSYHAYIVIAYADFKLACKWLRLHIFQLFPGQLQGIIVFLVHLIIDKRTGQLLGVGKFSDAEGQHLQLLCTSGSSPILSLKGGRVNDSNGSSVVTINTSQFKVNPDLPVAEKLQQWDITEGQNTAFISLSPELSNMSRNYVLETIARIKDEKVGRSDKPDFITVRAVLSHVRADICCYLLCSLELTGKRCYIEVTRNGDGTWYCDSCNQRTINWESRCLLLFQIKDHTGSTSFTAGASTDNIYILRALCADHGLYSDKQLQQFPWILEVPSFSIGLGASQSLRRGEC